MSDEPRELIALAAAVLDGKAVDWSEELRGAELAGDAERLRLVRSLGRVARVIEAHRDLHASAEKKKPGDPLGTLSFRSDPATSVDDRVRPGSTWGPLRLIERIGKGSFGHVYRAWDPRLEREVALKLLRGGSDPIEPTSVIEEGRLMARVRHPNVATVFGAETHDGRVGIWMEYVRGRTLAELVERQGPYGPREAAVIGLDLCRALAAVHGRSMLHRDIKARNVLREEGGRIVLTDFGAGREITRSKLPDGRLSGTPLYMAPELFRGEETSVRSDLYSLGVLLYFLVSGEFPVKAGSLSDLGQKHAGKERKRLRDRRSDLPPPFVDVVERAIDPDPARRFATAGELEAALGNVAGGMDESLGRRDTAAPARRRKWLVPVSAAAVVVMAAALAYWWPSRPPRLEGTPPRSTSSSVEPEPREDRTREKAIVEEPVAAALEAQAAAEKPEQPAPPRADILEEQVDGLSRLAEVYSAQGRYEEAAEAFGEILKLQAEDSGTGGTIRARLGLGWALHRMGRLDPARDAYEQALARQEDRLGRDHLDVADTLERLGLLLQDAGDTPAAEARFLRALRIREEAPGANDRSVATSLDRLAALYAEVERFDEAESLFERASAIRAGLLGEPPAPVDFAAVASHPLGKEPYTLDTALFRSRNGHVQRIRSGDRVELGDEVHMQIEASELLYVYVLTEDDTGRACLNFPVAAMQPTNPLPSGKRHRLPPKGTVGKLEVRGAWTVDSAGMRERIYLIGSPAPLQEFERVIAGLPREFSPELPCFDGDSETLEPLRGMTTLAVRPVEDSPGRLFEYARRLADGSEPACGVLIRSFQLQSPPAP